MGKQLVTVDNFSFLILYDYQHIRYFNYIWYFLRMCGIEAQCINIERDFYELDKNVIRQYSCCVYLSDKEVQDKEISFLLQLSQMDESNTCSYVLKQLFENKESVQVLDNNTCNILGLIANIYKKYSLDLHLYNCTHYSYDKNTMMIASKAFENAEHELFALYKEHKNKKDVIIFVQYARCFCASKSISICSKFEVLSTYAVSFVKIALNEMLKEHSSFYSIYILLAKLNESQGERADAVANYNAYLKRCDKKFGVIASDIWIRKAKIFEIMDEKKLSINCCEKALKCDKNNFVAEYKVVMSSEIDDGQFAWAFKCYSKMIRKFEYLLETGKIQPKELDYLFKLYFRCGRLYLKRLPNMENAIAFFEKTLSLTNITTEQVWLWCIIYEKDAEKYLKITKDRFPLYQIKVNIQEAKYNQKL